MIRISKPKREIATLAGDRVGALGPPLWSRMWGSGGAVGGILNQWGSGGDLLVSIPAIMDLG